MGQFGGELTLTRAEPGTLVETKIPPFDPEIKTTAAEVRFTANPMATILCIDDEANILHTRRLLLESEGYEVLEATTAAEGLRLLKSAQVDLVVLDYWMPGMNGMAAAREIKNMAPTLPVIMLSGLWELPGESVGIANRWILKGYSTKELLEAIKALL